MTNVEHTPSKIVPMQKAGRCMNGFEADHGTIIHGVEGGIEFCGGKALCGTQPGRRSVGWVKPWYANQVNCKKCLETIAKAIGKAA